MPNRQVKYKYSGDDSGLIPKFHRSQAISFCLVSLLIAKGCKHRSDDISPAIQSRNPTLTTTYSYDKLYNYHIQWIDVRAYIAMGLIFHESWGLL